IASASCRSVAFSCGAWVRMCCRAACRRAPRISPWLATKLAASSRAASTILSSLSDELRSEIPSVVEIRARPIISVVPTKLVALAMEDRLSRAARPNSRIAVMKNLGSWVEAASVTRFGGLHYAWWQYAVCMGRAERRAGETPTAMLGCSTAVDQSGLVDRLDHVFDDFLGVAKNHHGLVHVEQLVVQTGVAAGHGAL